MRALQLAVLIVLSLLIYSCGEKSGRGATVLSTQMLLDEVAGLAIDTVPEGSFVSFTGTTSKDSLWMNVYFDGKKGWLPNWSIVLDASPGYLTQTTDVFTAADGAESGEVLNAGTVVAVGQ